MCISNFMFCFICNYSYHGNMQNREVKKNYWKTSEKIVQSGKNGQWTMCQFGDLVYEQELLAVSHVQMYIRWYTSIAGRT